MTQTLTPPQPTALLAQPRGFCAGVTRAIGAVELALARHGAPVYVFHEIVHNHQVVQALRAQGAVFVDDLADVPAGAVTLFSAHGVGTAIEQQAASRQLRVIDATCPLVAKVHQHAQRYARDGRTVLVIGHADHDEVMGTLGAIDGPAHVLADVAAVQALSLPPGTPLAYVTQTTLSVDDTREVIQALQQRWPDIVGPALADICYATQNRQVAVRLMAPLVERLLVVGSRNSSNSCRLREVAEAQGVPARLVEHAGQLDADWLAGARRIGVTAGASTPEAVVQAVCQRLRQLGVRHIKELAGTPETVQFKPALDLPLAATV